MYFSYGQTEIDYLTSRDARLGWAIEQIGLVQREVHDDLFTAVVNCIVGQQISTAAHITIWNRFLDTFGTIDPPTICALNSEALQSLGISFRKADYILDFAQKVCSGQLDLDALCQLDDQAFIDRMITLRGIGVWTAEMLLTFCLQRPDVLSYGDLAIQRGLRMLYRHRAIDPARFAKYHRRYCPYSTTASLYLWAIAGGAIPDLTDPAPKKKPASSVRRSRNAKRPQI